MDRRHDVRADLRSETPIIELAARYSALAGPLSGRTVKYGS